MFYYHKSKFKIVLSLLNEPEFLLFLCLPVEFSGDGFSQKYSWSIHFFSKETATRVETWPPSMCGTFTFCLGSLKSNTHQYLRIYNTSFIFSAYFIFIKHGREFLPKYIYLPDHILYLCNWNLLYIGFSTVYL